MKASRLKSIIKEAVKEAIQEEIKDILLEALKSPKPQLVENIQPQNPHLNPNPTPPINFKDQRQAYMDILNETKNESSNVQTFNPQGVDSQNGALPQGEVPMDLIAQLTGK